MLELWGSSPILTAFCFCVCLVQILHIYIPGNPKVSHSGIKGTYHHLIFSYFIYKQGLYITVFQYHPLAVV